MLDIVASKTLIHSLVMVKVEIRGTFICYYAPPHRAEALSDNACLTSVCLSDVGLSRTSGLSREQRGLGRLNLTVTHDSDTTFKVKRSKVNLKGQGNIVAASLTPCLHTRLSTDQVILENPLRMK